MDHLVDFGIFAKIINNIYIIQKDIDDESYVCNSFTNKTIQV